MGNERLVWHTIQLPSVFPQENQHPSLFSRNALCVFSILSQRILNAHVLRGQDLTKLIIFTDLSRTFLKKIFFLCLFLRQRPSTSGGGAERETQNPK